jgi:uncharacterized protein YecE (DUF72 family)
MATEDLSVGRTADDPSTRKERRARRKARRAKQRKENMGRAARMHAARVVWEREATTLPVQNTGFDLPQINVGCSGWFYWHWRGGFYAADMPTSNRFVHYTHHFRTVELNAPFYSWPTPATVCGWRRQAGRRKFVYSVKVSELITHVKRFSGTHTLIRDFGHIADLLGPRMGCFLFQLPPSFHFSRSRLERIITQLDSARRNVVEFRHPSWWDERVFAAFRTNNIIFCSCSGPRLPDELVRTANEIYVRFHGVSQWYRHDYSPAELDVWAEKIRKSGARRVWAYFNNDRNGYAIKNSRALLRRIRVS